MQQNPNKRRGEERSETLIIPHITKEMVETARRMAEQGATRAEIEQAIAAMQAGTPVPKKPIVQPQAQPAAPAAQHGRPQRHRHHPHQPPALHRRRAPRHAGGGPAPPGRARSCPPGRSPRRGGAISAPTATGNTASPADSPPSQHPRPAVPAAPAQQPAARTRPAPTDPAANAPPAARRSPLRPGKPAQQTPPVCRRKRAPQHRCAAPEAPPRSRARPVPSTSRRGRGRLERAHPRRPHLAVQPCFVRGLGMAPVIGAALDGQRALMLCIAALILSPLPACWLWQSAT